MKSSNIFWGILLIAIGTLLLLAKLDLFHIDFSTIWKLWPLILIYFGISTLIKNQKQMVAILIAISFIGIGGIIYWTLTKQETNNTNRLEQLDEDEAFEPDEKSRHNKLKATFDLQEEIPENITTAKLDVDFGSGEFMLSETTERKIGIQAKTTHENFILEPNYSDEIASFKFASKSKKRRSSNLNSNEAHIKVYKSIPWQINANIGAADATFDFSNLEIESARLQIGAANCKIKLGNTPNNSEINVKSGAANLEIKIPQEANCQIRIKSGLSVKDITGFIKKEPGLWQSKNYNGDAKNVLELNLELGLANLEIKSY